MKTTTDLMQRILSKCQREGWYGPELRGPSAVVVSDNHPQRTQFAFPRASVDQIREAEAILGFALPPLLTTLYTQLANGGFGPGEGLRGIQGGFGSPTATQPIAATIPGYYPSATLIDWKQLAWRHRQGSCFLILSNDVWPKGLLRICDLGCVQEVCMESASEQLFMEEPLTSSPLTNHYILQEMGCSLVAWLNTWADS